MINAPNLLLPWLKDQESDPQPADTANERAGAEMKETVITMNVGRGANVEKTRRNLAKLDDRKSAIIDFQEVDEADMPNEHRLIKNTLGDSHNFLGFNTRTPIAIPKHYSIIAERVKTISRGVPNQTPARVAVSGIIQHNKKELRPIAILNSHAPRNTPQLRTQRADWVEGMRQEIDRLYRLGYTVIITCDPNNTPKNLHPGIRWPVDGRIDRIGYVAHNVKVKPLRTFRINMTIDGHDAHGVRLRLRNK